MISTEEPKKTIISGKGNNFSFGRIIDTLTIIAVAVLLTVVALAYMTNITMSSIAEWKELGFQAAILYVCSISVTLLLRSFGRRKGRETEMYKKAIEAVEKNAEEIFKKGGENAQKNATRKVLMTQLTTMVRSLT